MAWCGVAWRGVAHWVLLAGRAALCPLRCLVFLTCVRHTRPPPTPPPARQVLLVNQGLCLMFNASLFPCSGSGSAAGCPVVMGPCDAPGAVWEWALGPDASPVTSVVPGPLFLDVDCNYAAPHTLVKVLASGPANLVFVNGTGSTGVVQVGGTSSCLNTGQGPPIPPCGGKGEVYLPTQIQLAACSDPTAQGWSVQLV